MSLDSLYQHLILDHYRKPRNKGEMADASVGIHMANPTCGDEVHLYLQVGDGVVQDVRFTGQGCSISQASISIMTTLLKGKSLDEGLALAQRFTALMHGDAEAAKDRSLKDLRALQGVSKFPVRVKCALLGFDAFQEAAKSLREAGALPGIGDGGLRELAGEGDAPADDSDPGTPAPVGNGSGRTTTP